jgi:Domain of unknown function (DUF4440)
MKTTRKAILITGFISFACNVFAVSENPLHTVLTLEKQWYLSEKKNEPKLLDPLLSDKIIYTTEAGKLLGKKEVITVASETTWETVSEVGVKAVAFGDTVIVAGIFTGKGTFLGKPTHAKLRWTYTWIKKQTGIWQCIASQSTALTD